MDEIKELSWINLDTYDDWKGERVFKLSEGNLQEVICKINEIIEELNKDK